MPQNITLTEEKVMIEIGVGKFYGIKKNTAMENNTSCKFDSTELRLLTHNLGVV
jgi:hypothetical protein